MNEHLRIAEAALKKHEGLRLEPYLCSSGKRTIGYGRNLDDRGISVDEAEMMLANDIYACVGDLSTFDYWDKLSSNQKAALINMRFCLGATGYRSFKKMNAALTRGDYFEAAQQVLDSRFAAQVGRRATDISDMLILVRPA